MSLINSLPFIIYIFFLLLLGVLSYRRGADQEEYFLGNRSLSLPALVATIVTTWYGGILGVGEFIYLNGVSAWIVFGIPYYLFAALFAVFLAPRIRKEKVYSIPDILQKKYGKRCSILGSAFVIVMTSPAPYILMVGVLLKQIFGIGFISSILIATVISIGYVYWGGFRSVVQTDKLQFTLMFVGFILMFVFLITGDTSFNEVWNNLDPKHRDPTAGLPIQTIIVWLLIASWTFIDPGFHQRCSAAKTPALARRGILVSIFFWFIFDMLSVTTGLYAVIYLTGIDPLLSFPLLAEKVFSPFFASVFMVSLLAIIMSTVDSYAFLSAMTFGRDIVCVLNDKKENSNSYTKLGLILTGGISILLILWTPSVIQLWYNLGSFFIPPLLLPIILAYGPKSQFKDSSVFWIMLFSFLTTAGFFILGIISGTANEPDYPLGIQPFFAGILISIILIVYLLYKNRPRSRSRDKGSVQ